MGESAFSSPLALKGDDERGSMFAQQGDDECADLNHKRHRSCDILRPHEEIEDQSGALLDPKRTNATS